jgi:serine/threonine protein kinase
MRDSIPLAEGDLVAGRYRIVRMLGEGGMGAVYEAEHGWTRRRVALKVLRPSLAANDKIVKRFLREARACAKLSHPNLVEVLDMGQDEHDGLLFLAQELVEGESLRQAINGRGPLPPRDAVMIGIAIARALSVVHRAGIVHRDVKPDNIMLLSKQDAISGAKLIDFGIARELVPSELSSTATSLGVPIGTPLYMSPEQARASGAIDHRSDLYSLSAVLFECLSGRTAHEGESVTVLLANLLTRDPMPLSVAAPRVHPALAALVMRGLSRALDERFRSADEMADALTALEDEALAHVDEPSSGGASAALPVAIDARMQTIADHDRSSDVESEAPAPAQDALASDAQRSASQPQVEREASSPLALTRERTSAARSPTPWLIVMGLAAIASLVMSKWSAQRSAQDERALRSRDERSAAAAARTATDEASPQRSLDLIARRATPALSGATSEQSAGADRLRSEDAGSIERAEVARGPVERAARARLREADHGPRSRTGSLATNDRASVSEEPRPAPREDSTEPAREPSSLRVAMPSDEDGRSWLRAVVPR